MAVDAAAGISFISQTRVARLAALHRPEIGPMIEYLAASGYLAPLGPVAFEHGHA